MFRASPPTQKKFQAFPDKRRENVRCKVKGDLQPINKLRDLTSEQNCQFVLWVGSKRLIKRRLFDKFIEQEYSI